MPYTKEKGVAPVEVCTKVRYICKTNGSILCQSFISNCHLMDNLLVIFICSFDITIHLGSARRGIMMFNLEIVTQLLHHFVIQICPIISNDPAGNTIAVDNLILDKLDHHLLGYLGVRCRFNPLGEIINTY